MVLIGLMSTMVNDYSTQSVRIDLVDHYLPIAHENRNIVKKGPDVTYFWSHADETAANLARGFTNAATITANRV